MIPIQDKIPPWKEIRLLTITRTSIITIITRLGQASRKKGVTKSRNAAHLSSHITSALIVILSTWEGWMMRSKRSFKRSKPFKGRRNQLFRLLESIFLICRQDAARPKKCLFRPILRLPRIKTNCPQTTTCCFRLRVWTTRASTARLASSPSKSATSKSSASKRKSSGASGRRRYSMTAESRWLTSACGSRADSSGKMTRRSYLCRSSATGSSSLKTSASSTVRSLNWWVSIRNKRWRTSSWRLMTLYMSSRTTRACDTGSSTSRSSTTLSRRTRRQ